MDTPLSDFFFHPFTSTFILSCFLTFYMWFLVYEHAFDKTHFLRFGPSDDLMFFGMKIDTWNKVYVMIFVSFLSSFLIKYHTTVMSDFIGSKVWNPAFKDKMPLNKTATQLLLIMDPFIGFLLRILQFFVTMTMQLQFILPELIGGLLVTIPYSFAKSNEKRY